MKKVMRFLLGSFAALPLIACSSSQYGLTPPPDRTRAQPYTLSPLEIDAVKAAVAKRAQDPASASFGPMTAGKFPNGQIIVCGMFSGSSDGTMHPYAAQSESAGRFFVMQMVISSTFGLCNDRGIAIQRI